ncbi:MAG: hypothetical protein EOO10_15005 [Chitinophagaceae bacterium]|nr:MAG: hypothetical protein EOO10_15005 [Chitinophagaceae bacterium]
MTKETPVDKSAETTSVAIPAEKQNNTESNTPAVAPKKDSVATKDTIATKIAEPIAVKEKKKKEKKEASEDLVFSAGIGLQQAIAFDGQQTSSYNYNGKRNAISDRIPSVYVRLQKQKWYVQAEFQYAAPQPVKQFVFSQKTRYSIASQDLSTEQYRIQKLYYHQLPLTVNYHLLPNLSVGTGVMYSRLAGAVTEQAITSKNVQTGNESVSRNITPIKGFKDSFLYKSTAGIVVQTDYHWNRFSMGLRFSKNLLSFIRYTTPNGAIMDEKNKTLQAILRFRLFEK